MENGVKKGNRISADERRRRNREFMREYSKRPEVVERHRLYQLEKRRNDPEYRKKIAVSSRKYSSSEKGKAAKNRAQRLRRSNPEYRKKWNEYARKWMVDHYREDENFRARVNERNKLISREKRKDPLYRIYEDECRKERLIREPELRERIKETQRKYLLNPGNREKRRLSAAKRNLARYKEDAGYRMECILRSRLLGVLAGREKVAPTLALLGCSREEFVSLIEKQFKSGMSWGNHGEWHLDHRKPCAAFDLSDPAQQKECFHFSNFQPLWALENIKKGAKIIT